MTVRELIQALQTRRQDDEVLVDLGEEFAGVDGVDGVQASDSCGAVILVLDD